MSLEKTPENCVAYCQEARNWIYTDNCMEYKKNLKPHRRRSCSLLSYSWLNQFKIVLYIGSSLIWSFLLRTIYPLSFDRGIDSLLVKTNSKCICTVFPSIHNNDAMGWGFPLNLILEQYTESESSGWFRWLRWSENILADMKDLGPRGRSDWPSVWILTHRNMNAR